MEPKSLLAKQLTSFAKETNVLKRMMDAADKIAFARHPIREMVELEGMMIRSSPGKDEVRQSMVEIGRMAEDAAKAARESAAILRAIVPDVQRYLSEVENASD